MDFSWSNISTTWVFNFRAKGSPETAFLSDASNMRVKGHWTLVQNFGSDQLLRQRMSYSDMEFGRKDINLEAKLVTAKVKFSGQTSMYLTFSSYNVM